MVLSKENKNKIISILKKNDIVKASLFGSHAFGNPTKKSDIDLLVEFKGKKSLLDLVGVKIKLEQKIKNRFDLQISSPLFKR